MNPELNKPLKATLSITKTCDLLGCVHCYSDCTREADKRELTKEQWCNLIDAMIDDGIIQLFIEGGEPLHRPDFMEIVRHASRRLMLVLRTWGHLVTPEIAAEWSRLRVGTAIVDVHGAQANTHDSIVGVPGTFERSIAGVKSLVAAGVRVYMTLILHRRNYREVQDYLNLAHSLGAEKVGILRLYPMGRAKRRWTELALSLDEMMETINSLEVPSGLKLMQSWHPNDGNTCYQMAAVSAFGNSIGCPYLGEYVNYGNVLEMPFIETWEHPLWKRLRSGHVKQPCDDCYATQGSDGGCRATAYAFTGDWDAADPFCVVSNRGVDLRVLPERLLQEERGS
jgi:radical SAM protein with 4Fe4S-binding SPASM domain